MWFRGLPGACSPLCAELTAGTGPAEELRSNVHLMSNAHCKESVNVCKSFLEPSHPTDKPPPQWESVGKRRHPFPAWHNFAPRTTENVQVAAAPDPLAHAVWHSLCYLRSKTTAHFGLIWGFCCEGFPQAQTLLNYRQIAQILPSICAQTTVIIYP